MIPRTRAPYFQPEPMPKASTSMAKIDRAWLATPPVLAMTARARGLYATLIGIADDNGTVPMSTLKRNWPANPNRYLPELRKADLIIDSDDAVTVRALARLRRRVLAGLIQGNYMTQHAFFGALRQQRRIDDVLSNGQNDITLHSQDVSANLAADYVTKYVLAWGNARTPTLADEIPSARRLLGVTGLRAIRSAIAARCRPDLPPSQSLLECCAHLLPPDQAARHAA